MDAIQVFKALSDPTRLRFVCLLNNTHELCVCELTEIVDLPQPKVSHHLAILKKAGIVRGRKKGLWSYYRINPEMAHWAKESIQSAILGIKDDEPFSCDRAALAKLLSQAETLCYN